MNKAVSRVTIGSDNNDMYAFRLIASETADSTSTTDAPYDIHANTYSFHYDLLPLRQLNITYVVTCYPISRTTEPKI